MQKIIYLPGWLNSADNMRPLAEFVGGDFEILDFPTDLPRSVVEMADWAASKISAPAYIAGHSFGGKVAIAIASRHPEKVMGIFVIAGSNRGRWVFRMLKPAVKLAKWLGFSGRRFRTADYANSTPVMKEVMAKTLDFNIIPLARRVKCPATFIYGELDRTTPPTLGKKLATATPNAKFFALPGYTHQTVITSGVYQAGAIVKAGIPLKSTCP